MAGYIRTLPERRQDLISCNQLAKEDLAFDAQALSRHLREVKPSLAKTYVELGSFCLESFTADLGRDKKRLVGAGTSGFGTLSRFLAMAPALYRNYLEDTAGQADVEELRGSLKNSGETVKQFMELPYRANNDVEAEFALRTEEPTADPLFFEFQDTTEGLQLFADQKHFASYTRDKQYTRNLPEHWQRCPARRLVMDQIWPAMVDLATDTPEVFPKHLAELQLAPPQLEAVQS
jgi:hypothetical protein